jgi:creatinine amidohydrolase
MPFPSRVPSRYWADLATTDFAALDPARTVAVLPVAATEQHGPHLPLSVDQVLADGVVSASLAHLPADLPVLFLPTQAVGYSPEHTAFAGTLTLSAPTLIALWTELGESVARAGVKKLVLFNSHGGQVSLMDIVARELRNRCGLIVYSTSWYSLPLGDAVTGLFSADEHRFGVHAGEIETSMMLALCPQQVRMGQAQDFASASSARARGSQPHLGQRQERQAGLGHAGLQPRRRRRQCGRRHGGQGPRGGGRRGPAAGRAAAGGVCIAAVHRGRRGAAVAKLQ